MAVTWLLFMLVLFLAGVLALVMLGSWNNDRWEREEKARTLRNETERRLHNLEVKTGIYKAGPEREGEMWPKAPKPHEITTAGSIF
jgi:hypothetical protein